MEFDAAIFDLDGTLADTLEDIADAMNRVLGRRALAGHGLAAYRLMIGKGLRNLVGETLPLRCAARKRSQRVSTR